MRPYVIRPATAQDISRAYGWYERQRSGVGEELLVEVRSTIEAVLENPPGFPAVFRTTRRALVRRFPYGLFFELMDELIVFVACFPTRRAPSLLKRRR